MKLYSASSADARSSDPVAMIGCAGWTIPTMAANDFPEKGTHLQRYAARLSAVEINSSFYRPHRPETYARWAASVPDSFRFSIKLPRELTHTKKLTDTGPILAAFLDATAELGEKRGPILVQLPPSLAFNNAVASDFFGRFRLEYDGAIVCEPRHITWFTDDAISVLQAHRVGTAGVDPAIVDDALRPVPADQTMYRRLHGSPKTYYSDYSEQYLARLAELINESKSAGTAWCIFDNTAQGHAWKNALRLGELLL